MSLDCQPLKFLREGLLQQLDHDRHGRGRARRGAEQGADGAVAAGDDLGAELQHAALLRVLLDDLHPLAGGDEFPVAVLGLGVVLAQGLDLGAVALGDLLDQVGGEVHVVLGHGQHRDDVAGPDGQRQVQVGAVLQEVRGEAGVRAEQQGALAVDVAGVQVRHGHGRGAHGGLAVDLGAVLGREGLVGAAEELAGDREAAEALAFRDAGGLQQVQRAAAGADEDELGVDRAVLAGRAGA